MMMCSRRRRGTLVRVLVVEDEKRLAAGLKKGLEAEGFATDVALERNRRAVDGARESRTTRSCWI